MGRRQRQTKKELPAKKRLVEQIRSDKMKLNPKTDIQRPYENIVSQSIIPVQQFHK